MAAVGLTWEEAKARCPEGIVPACYNAKDSVTISGAKQQVLDFVEKLQSDGIFAKEVNSAGIAFHSHYMQGVAKPMKEYLSKVEYIRQFAQNRFSFSFDMLFVRSSQNQKNVHQNGSLVASRRTN